MNGHLLRRSLAVVMMSLGLSSNARAQSAYIQLGYPAEPQCVVAPGFWPNLTVYVATVGPLHTARFKVVASSPVTIFNPPGGEFDLTSTPCTIGAFANLVVLIPPGPPVTFTFVPATGHAEIELTDCDGYAMRTVNKCGSAQLLGPYRPDPPDGAINVSTDQLLSYVGDANYVALSTNPDMNIWDPTNVVLCNKLVQGGTGLPCPLPLNPGPLAPHTTYYWQAINFCVCGQVTPGTSEVFSFTTGDAPLAVETSTWGRVKAMYRD